MPKPPKSLTEPTRPLWQKLGTLAIICGAVAVLFHRSLDPSEILFNNDNPLGGMMGAFLRFPACFIGGWQD